MEVIDINSGSPHFDRFWEIYDSSFPDHEKQSRQRVEYLLADGESIGINGLMKDGKVVGFFLYWYIEDMVYLEHFAVDEKYRCSGIGSEALRSFITRHSPDIVVGEIEPPIDDITSRRAAFYSREGFIQGEKFLFPAYKKGGESFEMIFISHKERIDSEKFERYKCFLKDIVTNGD